MNHSFNAEIATLYGIEEAIILENIAFWCSKNEANDKHFYNGDYWTYNSAKAFAKLLPYMSEHIIQRKLKNLENLGLIKTDEFNKSPYDRTKWYALTEKSKPYYRLRKNAESAKQDCSISETEMPDQKNENAESSITNINNTSCKRNVNVNPPAADDPSPTVTATITTPKEKIVFTETQIKEHAQKYPDVDIHKEIDKMQKHINDMPKCNLFGKSLSNFITRWFDREQNTGRKKPAAFNTHSHDFDVDTFLEKRIRKVLNF